MADLLDLERSSVHGGGEREEGIFDPALRAPALKGKRRLRQDVGSALDVD